MNIILYYIIMHKILESMLILIMFYNNINKAKLTWIPNNPVMLTDHVTSVVADIMSGSGRVRLQHACRLVFRYLLFASAAPALHSFAALPLFFSSSSSLSLPLHACSSVLFFYPSTLYFCFLSLPSALAVSFSLSLFF